MGQGSGRIFNIITLIFIILTILTLLFGIGRLLGPPIERVDTGVVPEVLQLPTVTASFTPTETLLPTWTFTPSPAPTDAPTEPTPTITPSLAPSLTITPTPSITPTPTITPTETPTDLPTATETPDGPTPEPTPTLSPYPFALRENKISLYPNFTNTLGCQWQGIGGAVFDLAGQPYPQLVVHVYDGAGFDFRTTSGSTSFYNDASGWEIQVSNSINNQTYFVELMTGTGISISPIVQVTFPGSCDGNVAVITFEQTRPLN